MKFMVFWCFYFFEMVVFKAPIALIKCLDFLAAPCINYQKHDFKDWDRRSVKNSLFLENVVYGCLLMLVFSIHLQETLNNPDENSQKLKRFSMNFLDSLDHIPKAAHKRFSMNYLDSHPNGWNRLNNKNRRKRFSMNFLDSLDNSEDFGSLSDKLK